MSNLAFTADSVRMTVDEVAATLGISRYQVYQLVKAGAIPHYNNGRAVVFIRPEIMALKAGQLPTNGHRPAKSSLDWQRGFIAGRFDQLCNDINQRLSELAEILKKGGNA